MEEEGEEDRGALLSAAAKTLSQCPSLVCSRLTGWFFGTSQAFNAAELESRSGPANTLMEHLR